MSKMVKKIVASVSAALMLGVVIVKAPSSKVNAMYRPYMPPAGVPAYVVPGGQPHAVPYAQPIQQSVTVINGMPTPIRLPYNYSHNYIIYNGMRCPIVFHNGQRCYQLGNRYYPIYY